MKDELSRRKFLADSLSVTAAVPFLALVGASACKSEAPAEKPAEKPAEGGAADGAKPAEGALLFAPAARHLRREGRCL